MNALDGNTIAIAVRLYDSCWWSVSMLHTLELASVLLAI